MKKNLRVLLIVAAALPLLTVIFFIASPAGNPRESAAEPRYLSNLPFTEVREIHIQNRFDRYTVRFDEDGILVFADLPAEALNREYALMLLDEAARIECLTVLADDMSKPPGQYGFDPPEAEVTIRYNGGRSLFLTLGAEEKISGERYVFAEGELFTISNSRAVRFIMPLTRYINYEIVPFIKYQSPLNAVKKLVLAGQAFPRPIVIEAVRSGDEQAVRDASSFGAVTHLIRSPALHKLDQKEGIEVFASVTGLLNKDVFAYNVSGEELDALGFGDPWVRAEFDFQAGADDPVEHIILRAVKRGGETLLVRDEVPVIHRIENGEAFLSTSYEKLVIRWFLSPFITDIQTLELSFGQTQYRFEFAGETNRELRFLLDGKPLDSPLFRKLYSLLVSAANDGVFLEHPVRKDPPLMRARFHYRDPFKPPDTMILYEGDFRRHTVEVNGLAEFAMLRGYLPALKEAAAALVEGRDFSANW